jgi:hypothetical protein
MRTRSRIISGVISLWIGTALSVAGFYISPVYGQDAALPIKGISISPPLKEVVLGPGLIEARSTVTLTNNSGQTVTARLRLVDLQSLDEFGGVSLGQVGAISTKYALAQWMNLPESSEIVIQNGKTVQIPITIQNSDEMSPGGHYGALIANIQATSKSANSRNQIKLNQELVSLLFVKKVGGEAYGLQAESLKVKGGSIIPDTANIVFKNTGNVHVVPRGYIEVTDAKGLVVAKGIINPESTLVLPDKSREYTTILQPVEKPVRTGEYTVTAYYRYDGKDDFAKYSITYGTNAPVLLIVGPFVVLVLLACGVWLVRNNPSIKKLILRSRSKKI